MTKLCALCRKNKTGRLIKGIPVCDACFVEGKYSLPENREKLGEVVQAQKEAKQAKKQTKTKA